MRRQRVVFALALLLAIACGEARASGPFFPEPVFVRTRGPDSLAAFAVGRLGIVVPEHLSTSQLVVAWRWMRGPGLTRDEQSRAVRLWTGGPVDSGLAAWRAARALVRGVAPAERPQDWRMLPGAWNGIQNCGDDAFVTAARTLRERAAVWGWSSAELRQWVEGQDAVFASCAETAPLPPEVSEAATPLRADRAYQRAAAHFYRLELADARAGFEAIARDRASPWRLAAPYLVARTWVREATLAPDSAAAARNGALDQALRRLDAVLAAPEQRRWHDAAEALRAFVVARRDPVRRVHELAQALETPGRSRDFARDLHDLAWLLDREPRTRAVASSSPLVAWIARLRGWIPGRDATAVWRADPNSATLFAALRAAPTPELESIAGRGVMDTPRGPTLHAAVAALEVGRGEDATAQIQALLAFPGLGPSDRNRVLDLALQNARTTAELARALPRMPVAIGVDGDEYVPSRDDSLTWSRFASGPYLDARGEAIVNRRLPSDALMAVVTTPAFPRALGVRLARAAWLRSVLVGRDSTAAAIAGWLVAHDAALAPSLRTWLARVPASATDAEWRRQLRLGDRVPRAQNPSVVSPREFETAWILLRFPGLSPWADAGAGRLAALDRFDSYRENLWCPVQRYGDSPLGSSTGSRRHPSITLPPDSAAAIARAAGPVNAAAADAEYAAIQRTQGAVAWLGPRVIEWAKAHRDDPRAPEALHRLVRLTRVGCFEPDPGPISREAFATLHRLWPRSEWARRTPYWYANR